MARIILVDDDQDILTMGRALLAQAGHDVLVASSAMQAIEQLNQFGCDAMITDINMPQHNGYDLVRTLRNNAKWVDLPIAMLTARRERRDIERALELGVDDYVLKPIDAILLLKKVEHLLQKNSGKTQNEKTTEIDFARANMQSKGRISSDIELRSISEFGLVLTSQHKFTEGGVVRVDADLFTEMGCEPPPMKVISSVPLQGVERHETRLLFIGADEAVLSKIRAWIFSHATKARRQAG